VCFPNNPLDQKFLNKKSNQPNKGLIPDPKQNQSGWLENTSSTLNQTENHGLTRN
jgi:hypothetical protein